MNDRQGYRQSKNYTEKAIPPMPFDPETATAQEFLDYAIGSLADGLAVQAEEYARRALKHPRLSQREFAHCHLILAKSLLAQGNPTAGDHAAEAVRIASRSGLPDLTREAQEVAQAASLALLKRLGLASQ